jgi:hypothetical protein
MFEDCSGRLAKTQEDAECYLWRFMSENMCCKDKHVTAHLYDFDLYLPWLLEILEYQKPEDKSDALPIIELQRLFMDAAWSLVMQGFLRPGPKTISGDPLRDGYGKGYSLTISGQKRIALELKAAS